MFDLEQMVGKAKTSPFYLRMLNWGLSRMIPFNRPHRFKIISFKDFEITTLLPYRRSNLNHIKGLHACSMATIAEFTTGFLLLSNLDAKKYRLIMKKIEMEFFYQGKMDSTAHFTFDQPWLNTHVIEPVEKDGKVEITCEVDISDIEKNKLATGKVTWQIKRWDLVKTKQ